MDLKSHKKDKPNSSKSSNKEKSDSNEKYKSFETDYSEQTLDLFSSVSAYFCDTFCNVMFKKSTEIHLADTSKPLKQIYESLLKAYLKELEQRNKEYKTIIMNLKRRYESYIMTKNEIPMDITPTEFINICIQEFLPQDDYKFLNQEKDSLDKKDKILHNVLNEVLPSFAVLICKEYLDLVLDLSENRKKRKDEFIGLKEELVNLLILERQKLFLKILDPKSDKKSNNLQQQLLEKLREQIELNTQQKQEIAKRNKIIQNLMLEINTQKQEYKVMRDQFLRLMKVYGISKEDMFKISKMTSKDISEFNVQKSSNQSFNLFDNNTLNKPSDADEPIDEDEDDEPSDEDEDEENEENDEEPNEDEHIKGENDHNNDHGNDHDEEERPNSIQDMLSGMGF